jgi:hypothetical protein
MKKWQAISVLVLVTSLLVLSACDLLGLGSSKSEEREYYEQQIKAYQQVQEANRKAQEAYYESLQKGLEEWSKAYAEWSANMTQQQVQAAAAQKARQGQ